MSEIPVIGQIWRQKRSPHRRVRIVATHIRYPDGQARGHVVIHGPHMVTNSRRGLQTFLNQYHLSRLPQ